MNEFQSTSSGGGLLKDVYNAKTPIESALSEKRKKRVRQLYETKDQAENSEPRD